MSLHRSAMMVGLGSLCGAALVAMLALVFLSGGARGQAVTSDAPRAVNHAHHDHEALLPVQGDPPPPTLGIDISRDPKSGWNLKIATTNFRFSPENASGPHRTGEGHAHLYVNGQKRARIYGRWFHIGDLPKGEVDVRVTLNSNDHRLLSVGKTPLEVRQTLIVE